MIKKAKSYMVISLLLISSSCVTVPNILICSEVTMAKGICVYTVTGDSFIVDDDNLLDGETWFSMRNKTLTMPAKSWAKLKAFLIKQCKKSNKCEKDISSWDRQSQK